MATIKHDPIGDVDVSGASFVQQGSSIAETFAPNVLEFLGQTGLDQFKKSRLQSAEGEAKNLLEALTGEKAFLQIGRDEADLLAVEEDLAGEFARQDEGSPEQQFTRSQLLGIQQQKADLETAREAVIQGLLTEDQYRKRAEQSFYTQVALTPGIRDELAAVMAEHLGIDPRGQTAKITLEARRKLGEQKSRARTKQLDMITAHGFGDVGMSDQEMINNFWPLVQKRVQGVNNIKDLVQQLNAEETITKNEAAGIAQHSRAWIADALPLALQEMGSFKGVSAYSLTVEDIRSMDPQTRIDWLDNISAVQAQFTTPVAQLAARTGEKYEEAFTAAENRATLLKAIVSGEGNDEVMSATLKRMQTDNNIELELEKANIIRTNRGVATLGALAQLLPIEPLLATRSAATSMLIEAMNGSVTNLENVDKADAADLLNKYRQVVSQAASGWLANGKNWTDEDVLTAGRGGNMIANQSVGNLGDQERMHLFKLAGAKGFMERLEAVAPQEAQKMKEGVIKHQAALGRNWNTEAKITLDNRGLPLTTLDFHIKRIGDEDSGWLVAMNSQAKDTLLESLSRIPRGRTSIGLQGQAKNRAMADAAEAEVLILNDLNRTANLVNNMVKAKAASMSIPMESASRLVARDLGISMQDVETTVLKNEDGTQKERPGFAEENLGRTLEQGPDVTAQAILQIVAQTGASFEEVKEFIEEQRKLSEAQ